MVVVSTVHAGDFFGENALLEGLCSPQSSVSRALTARCTAPSEVLQLAKDDFDIGFLGRSSPCSSRSPEEARELLLRFIQMVTGSREVLRLARGDPLFHQGDVADRLYIVSSGTLTASHDLYRGGDGQGAGGAPTDGLPFAEMGPGECCGEMALLNGSFRNSANVACAADSCTVVAVSATDFLRLVTKSQMVRESFEKLVTSRKTENKKVFQRRHLQQDARD